MNRLYTHYRGHVENLNAALKDISSDDAREALSLLQSDGVAQVMSFMSERSLNKAALTLAATSPEMKLDVEALAKHYLPFSQCVRVRVLDQMLVFCIDATYRPKTSPALMNSLWWAERRGMTVKLDTENACSVLIEVFSGDLRSRVEALEILVDEATLCARHLGPERESAASVCNGECGTLLCALSTFPNLTLLSIESTRIAPGPRVDAAVRRALCIAADMKISAIGLEKACQICDFSVLPPSQHLCFLKAHNCGITSLTGLERYSMLTYLEVCGNKNLHSLRGLADASRLEEIVAKKCRLQDVEGLGQCLQLREVDVSFNSALRSLSGFAGVPWLEKVVAKGCGLQDVEGLSQCPHLREIDVSGNNDLSSLHVLAGAPKLEKVVAHQCGLQDVEGLGQCLQLREIDVSNNSALRFLSGLAGAPKLQQITAKYCKLEDVEMLRSRLPSCKLIL